jgi:pimeloyl-ACP methyl ester carboxylesterase
MRRAIALLALLVVAIGAGRWFEARRPAPAARLGIVLIHGMGGSPQQFGQGLAARFEAAGYLVDRPEMCFSAARNFDKPFLDCLADIDAAIARLKARGAAQFVIAGQSLGASAALAYGARHEGLKGIVAMAPAPPPGIARRPEIAPELVRAQALVTAGHGDDKVDFTDLNVGVPFTVAMTPAIYLSFLAFEGPANLVANAVHLKAPVLWISGLRDPTQIPRSLGFDRAAPDPLDRYVEIDADHYGTPAASGEIIIGWLKELAKN